MPTFPGDTALVMIDIQNDFCPGGALAVAGGDEIVAAVNALQDRFAVRILSQDWHPADHSSFADNNDAEPFSMVEMSYGLQVMWPRHCVQGSTGAAFHSDLQTDSADLVIRKGFRAPIDSYSAFYENDKTTQTGLAGYLRERGVDKLVMVGLATDFCVYFSAIDGVASGFGVTVLMDCCRAIDLDGSLAAAVADMEAKGVAMMDSGDL
ncbi:MAG: bifunctional nicotinamidase/pyrazinamidase [Pseudomonadota bacterium]